MNGLGIPDEVLDLETNLLPAFVPSSVITTQPASRKSLAEPEVAPRKTSHHYTRKQKQNVEPSGLASLAVAELLLIEIDLSWGHCDWSTRYTIKDFSSEESLVFNAIEEIDCCNCTCGSLRNVVIRDREGLPVARACFKEKSCLYKSLVLAVYSPPESLIGTIEESSGICMLSSKFVLGNEDGNNIFGIEYIGGFCNSYFIVKSLENNNEEVAKILEKTKRTLRLQFLSKMNISNKLLLVGFCIGMIHKSNMGQSADPS